MDEMDNNIQSEIDGLVFRQHVPDQPPPHRVILMLHGWTGDENVMWLFASRLPKDALLIAPRGLYPIRIRGYGWTPELSHNWPQVDDFRPAADQLMQLLRPENFPTAYLDEFDIVGFSQGAALGISMALLYPERVGHIAGLSGFVPEGAASFVSGKPLVGKSAFLAHGTQDDLVPVERARKSVEILRRAGAEVYYCEDDVGHKLSAMCYHSLADFFL